MFHTCFFIPWGFGDLAERMRIWRDTRNMHYKITERVDTSAVIVFSQTWSHQHGQIAFQNLLPDMSEKSTGKIQ